VDDCGSCSCAFASAHKKRELKTFVTPAASGKEVVTKEMLDDLPLVVQKWLERTRVIGKEISYRVHLKQVGEMRTTPDGKWMPVKAEQWFKTEKPSFIRIADFNAAPGIHLAGRDKYENGKGHRKPVDSTTAKAAMNYGGITASGLYKYRFRNAPPKFSKAELRISAGQGMYNKSRINLS